MSPADRIGQVPGRFRQGGMLGRLALGAPAVAVAILVWGSDFTPEKSNLAQIQPEPSSNRHRRIAPAQPTGAAPKSRTSAMMVLDANSKEVASLITRGQSLALAGDVAAARLPLQRAAKTGNAFAVLALAATYDPNVLEQVGIYGAMSDVTEARRWYQRAEEYGSSEAPRRLEMLLKRERR